MDVLVPIIIERGSGSECSCIDSIYNEPDPDCDICLGAGTVISRNRQLAEASMQTSAQIIDEGDPIIYACTFNNDIQPEDVIVCKGKRYVVLEISSEVTVDGRDVIVAGLDYERNYDHSQTILNRYK